MQVEEGELRCFASSCPKKLINPARPRKACNLMVDTLIIIGKEEEHNCNKVLITVLESDVKKRTGYFKIHYTELFDW